MKRSRKGQGGTSGNSPEALRPRRVCPTTTRKMPRPRTESTHGLRPAVGVRAMEAEELATVRLMEWSSLRCAELFSGGPCRRAANARADLVLAGSFDLVHAVVGGA